MTTTTAPPPPVRPLDDLGSQQRVGGIAALVKAATYLVGFVVMGAYLGPRGLTDAQGDPAASLAFLLDNQTAMYSWYLVLYIVGGFALVSLVLGVHARLKTTTGTLMQTATVTGITWAALLLASGLVALVGQQAVIELAATEPMLAASTWSSVSVVQDALGGGIEIVGAVWVLLASVAAIRSGALGYRLPALGIAIGVAGAWTLVPAVADDAASLFGIGFIVWFVWMGVSLLRRPRQAG